MRRNLSSSQVEDVRRIPGALAHARTACRMSAGEFADEFGFNRKVNSTLSSRASVRILNEVLTYEAIEAVLRRRHLGHSARLAVNNLRMIVGRALGGFPFGEIDWTSKERALEVAERGFEHQQQHQLIAATEDLSHAWRWLLTYNLTPTETYVLLKIGGGLTELLSLQANLPQLKEVVSEFLPRLRDYRPTTPCERLVAAVGREQIGCGLRHLPNWRPCDLFELFRDAGKLVEADPNTEREQTAINRSWGKCLVVEGLRARTDEPLQSDYLPRARKHLDAAIRAAGGEMPSDKLFGPWLHSSFIRIQCCVSGDQMEDAQRFGRETFEFAAVEQYLATLRAESPHHPLLAVAAIAELAYLYACGDWVEVRRRGNELQEEVARAGYKNRQQRICRLIGCLTADKVRTFRETLLTIGSLQQPHLSA